MRLLMTSCGPALKLILSSQVICQASDSRTTANCGSTTRHVNTGGCWGCDTPQSFIQSENLRKVGKFNAVGKKLG